MYNADLEDFNEELMNEEAPTDDDIRFRQYTNMVLSSDKIVQFDGIIGLRKICSSPDIDPSNLDSSIGLKLSIDRIKQIVSLGVTENLLEALKMDDNAYIQLEAAWIVANLCSDTSEIVNYIIDLGALDAITYLLDSPSKDVFDQALWIVGNIAGDCPESRDLCLNKGYMEKIMRAFKEETNEYLSSTQKTAVWVISNLANGSPPPNWQQVSIGVLQIVKILPKLHYEQELKETVEAIISISESFGQKVIELGCIPRLIEYLNSKNHSLVRKCLDALYNFALVDKDQVTTSVILSNKQFLPAIHSICESNNRDSRHMKTRIYEIIREDVAHSFQKGCLVFSNPDYKLLLERGLYDTVHKINTETALIFAGLSSLASHEQLLSKMEIYQRCIGVLLNEESRDLKGKGIIITFRLLKAGIETAKLDNVMQLLAMGNLIEVIEELSNVEFEDCKKELNEIISIFQNYKE